jgi:hypothetical protein
LILGYQKLERLFVATLDAINQKLINVAFCCQSLIPLADASDATLWNFEKLKANNNIVWRASLSTDEIRLNAIDSPNVTDYAYLRRRFFLFLRNAASRLPER